MSYEQVSKPSHDLFVPKYPGQIDTVRNGLIEQALQAGVTHLWMTDTDQIYHDPDTLNKMLAHNKPIVSAPVYRRYPPFDPIMYRRHDDKQIQPVGFNEVSEAVKDGKILDIDVTGMGCVLFDMKVFLDIEAPWFKLPEYDERGPGEDIYFWKKANEAGYSIAADFSIKVEHMTTMAVGYDTYALFKNLIGGMKNGKRE